MYIFIFYCTLLFQPAPLIVINPDFPHKGDIPVRFTCEGENINPTLLINGIPEGTKSLALIVEDPDAPLAIFTQWVVWDIPPVDTIMENTVPGIQGINSVGKNPYRGPCPVAGSQRYIFKVYALNALLKLKRGSKRKKVEEAMQPHILVSGELAGQYNRSVATTEKEK